MLSEARYRGLEVEQIGDITIGKFTHPRLLDEDSVRLVGKELSSLVEELGLRHIILNFGPVKRMSSTMLRKLMAFREQVARAGGRLAVCSLHADLHRAFQSTQLDKVLSIYRDEQEALQSF
jgi:anti-anti-sigma factor